MHDELSPPHSPHSSSIADTVHTQKHSSSEVNDPVKDVLSKFKGVNKQIPPMYSAKKVNGIRLYKLARQNKTVERDPVDINILDIQLIKFKSSIITFKVKCSKGTYVRVLGADIAKKLGTVGHLSSLSRTSIGLYNIDDSKSIEEISAL